MFKLHDVLAVFQVNVVEFVVSMDTYSCITVLYRCAVKLGITPYGYDLFLLSVMPDISVLLSNYCLIKLTWLGEAYFVTYGNHISLGRVK